MTNWLTDLFNAAEPFVRSQHFCNYSRNPHCFMKPKYSLLCSQQPTIAPLLNQTNQAHAPPSYLFKLHFNIIVPSTLRSSKNSVFQASPPNFRTHFCCSHTCHKPRPSRHPNNIWRKAARCNNYLSSKSHFNRLKKFKILYLILRPMLAADVAVSSSHDTKPSMSCILYPMMNFSSQHWQTVYIFKTKFVVDLVYLYRTNFQNVDTVVVSNNTTDTCSAHPHPNPTPTGGSSITLTRILTCNFSFPYFSIGVCPRTSQHVAPCWFSMNGCSRNSSERAG